MSGTVWEYCVENLGGEQVSLISPWSVLHCCLYELQTVISWAHDFLSPRLRRELAELLFEKQSERMEWCVWRQKILSKSSESDLLGNWREGGFIYRVWRHLGSHTVGSRGCQSKRYETQREGGCVARGFWTGEPICCKVFVCWLTSVVSTSLWCHGQYPTRLLCPWGSPGKNTGAGCHFLLQEAARWGSSKDVNKVKDGVSRD